MLDYLDTSAFIKLVRSEPESAALGTELASELRSLDALHLAAAISLGRDLGRFFCYDARLGTAARALGLDVRHPA